MTEPRSLLRRHLLALPLAGLALPVRSATGTLTPWTGSGTPALALRDLAGQDVRLAQFRGRTVIVNFWATWCAPCVAEMPSLNELRNRHARDGLEVLAVNFKENQKRVEDYVAQAGLSFPVVRDHDGSVTEAWGVRVFPSSYVVGPVGRIELAAIGELDWMAPSVAARLQQVMTRTARPPTPTTA